MSKPQALFVDPVLHTAFSVGLLPDGAGRPYPAQVGNQSCPEQVPQFGHQLRHRQRSAGCRRGLKVTDPGRVPLAKCEWTTALRSSADEPVGNAGLAPGPA